MKYLAVLFLVVLFGMPAMANAQALVCDEESFIRWDANVEPDLGGYKVYAGFSSGNYASTVDVGLTAAPASPQVKLPAAGVNSEQPWFLVITAYDTSQNESGFSNEVNCFFDQKVGDTSPPASPQNTAITGGPQP